METTTFERDLDLARDGLGRPLAEGSRARLMAAVRNPGQVSWDAAYPVILNRSGTTLWQAVLVVDPGFGGAKAPVTSWVPDAEDCDHPECRRDYRGLGGGRWTEACEDCGASRPVHLPDDCLTCDSGGHHAWQPDPEQAHEVRSPWSRTPSAWAIRQAIAFATH